jgi:hypothetical protein
LSAVNEAQRNKSSCVDILDIVAIVKNPFLKVHYGAFFVVVVIIIMNFEKLESNPRHVNRCGA